MFRISLQLLSETFFILGRNERERERERERIENVYRASCEALFVLFRFE